MSFVQLSHFLWLQMINRLHYDKWSTQKLLCVCACMCVRRPTPQSLRTGSALSRPTPHGFTQLTVPSLCPSQYTHTDLPLWYRNSKCNLTKVLFQQKGNRNSGISGNVRFRRSSHFIDVVLLSVNANPVANNYCLFLSLSVVKTT